MADKPPITIAELGRLLKLDKSTVSLALRDSPKIAAGTRRRVQAEARRRDYRPNLAARRLSAPATAQVVGLVLPADLDSLSSPLAVRAIQLLAARASARGLLCQLVPASEPLIGRAAALPLDAAWAWGDVPRERLARLRLGARPLLVIDPNHPSWAGGEAPRLRLANREAATALVAHLAERGARRVLFVRGRDDHLGHGERRDGARAAWAGRGAFAELASNELDDARLRAHAGADAAILCSNDAAALIVRHRLQRLGLAARLAGFDGEPLALRTGLTTAVFDHERLADAAIAALLDGARPEPVPAAIAVGETT